MLPLDGEGLADAQAGEGKEPVEDLPAVALGLGVGKDLLHPVRAQRVDGALRLGRQAGGLGHGVVSNQVVAPRLFEGPAEDLVQLADAAPGQGLVLAVHKLPDVVGLHVGEEHRPQRWADVDADLPPVVVHGGLLPVTYGSILPYRRGP